ncbi:LysE family translocator [Pseudomonas citronellolis]|uniref:LysE family translocator n=1 Tax=Pseudomonas citronellolis TaxID=53408 RepID=UPI0023E464D6|nr:LysE family translocator [Pseudomonas citronellolis]MDF3934830.1 LysE family translocator [Pseudomonas citronellolis]
MSPYLLYIAISALTIASPGPGVLLTLSNTLAYSFRQALPGILGVTLGMGAVALVAATSVGILVSSSLVMMNAVRLAGALYLIHLGIKLIRTGPKLDSANLAPDSAHPGVLKLFGQGALVSLLNPKPIIFFMALFPQFLEEDAPFIGQFTLLATTFCVLVFLIHCGYAIAAEAATKKLAGSQWFTLLNRLGGTIFILFAAALICSIRLSTNTDAG